MKNLYWGNTLFLLVFIPIFSFAQNTLNGTVLDDEGQPLYGATVIIKGSNEGTVTGVDGAFNLTTERSFPLELEISFVGFDNLNFNVADSQPQRYQLSFSNRFDEIIVSASRKAEKLQEAPAAVSVISAKQVTQSGGAVFPGNVPAKNLVDITLGLKLSESLRFELAGINVLNNRFRALPSFPRLGRTVTGRLVMNLN